MVFSCWKSHLTYSRVVLHCRQIIACTAKFWEVFENLFWKIENLSHSPFISCCSCNKHPRHPCLKAVVVLNFQRGFSYNAASKTSFNLRFTWCCCSTFWMALKTICRICVPIKKSYFHYFTLQTISVYSNLWWLIFLYLSMGAFLF